MTFKRYTLILVAVVISFSCSVSRRLPEGSYLLTKNSVNSQGAPGVKRSEEVRDDALSVFIKQSPNKKLLFFRLSPWIYNLADPADSNRINRWIRGIGAPPVVYDSSLAIRSASDMAALLKERGFLDADVSREEKYKRSKKIKIDYNVTPGTPYRINRVSYDLQDTFLEPILRADSANTLLRPGGLFDTEVLDAERRRIASYLKGEGYYTFSMNNISYVADTLGGGHKVDLTVVVKRRVSGYDGQDKPILDNNTIFRIGEIKVVVEGGPAGAGDSSRVEISDTLEYRGVTFIYKGTDRVKPEVLQRCINIYPNYIYSESQVKKASNDLLKLNYFRNVSILFSEIRDTSSYNMVTFVGDGGDAASNLTREGYLSCEITCIPGDKHGVGIDLEATTTSSYYGILTTLGYQNRNIFKGVEQLEVKVTGGYEFMRDETNSNSFEIGGSVSLTFARFVAPVRFDRYNRMNNARSRIELAANSQNRPYYDRFLLSGNFGYSWTNRKYSSFSVRPIDVSIVKLPWVDSTFYKGIENPYLQHSYSDQIIIGMSGSYLYNNQSKEGVRNTFRLRVNGETSGNLAGLIVRAVSKPSSDGSYDILGVQYSQYARADVDISYKFPLGKSTSLVYRVYTGGAVSYGNHTSVPFERMFYSGGPNSMRGWVARTLGPGVEPPDNSSVYPQKLGNFKLETNFEFRFPVYNFINGAVFTDIGNIWMVGKGTYTPDTEFRFDTFYRQLGIDWGIGIRLDFGLLLLRGDWGYKLHDPGKPEGERWARKFSFSESAFNFGIGYPF